MTVENGALFRSIDSTRLEIGEFDNYTSDPISSTTDGAVWESITVHFTASAPRFPIDAINFGRPVVAALAITRAAQPGGHPEPPGDPRADPPPDVYWRLWNLQPWNITGGQQFAVNSQSGLPTALTPPEGITWTVTRPLVSGDTDVGIWLVFSAITSRLPNDTASWLRLEADYIYWSRLPPGSV